MMNKNLLSPERVKFIFLLISLASFPTGVSAQKQDAAATVESFYRFHFSREDAFNEKEIALRRRFFTPRLQKLFDAELKREKIYLTKYPNNKAYFQGLSFQPIEFCESDYRVGTARTNRRTAVVKVHFVYGKSSCEAGDGTPLVYKISLKNLDGSWLIDDVIYDGGDTLTEAFNRAQKIR